MSDIQTNNAGAEQQKQAATEAQQKTTLDNIQGLQDMEKRLYVELEVDAASRNPDVSQQQATIDQVNKLSQMRVNLYEQLRDNYKYLSDNVAETRDNLVNQTAVTKIVEGELNNAKKQLRQLDDAKYNKLRMVEINTYEAKKIAAYKNMMMVVAIACIPLIVVTLLYNSDLLNDNLAVMLFSLIVIGTLLYLAYLGVDISMRDNMNFDEYEFAFDKAAVADRINSSSSSSSSSDTQASVGSSGMVMGSCSGESCCAEGTKWSSTENKCVTGLGESNDSGATAIMSGNPSDGSANGATTSGSDQVMKAQVETTEKSEGFTQLFRSKNNLLQSVFNSNKVNTGANTSRNFVEPYGTDESQFASV